MNMQPIICFGQQPNGIFPKKFFIAKINTARKLQKKIGGKIVWFCHDSDHDYRETKTRIESDNYKEGFIDMNFTFKNKIQRKYTPLYLKEIQPGWKKETRRILERIISPELLEIFDSVTKDKIADFCIDIYKKMDLLEGIEIVRSSDPSFRKAASDPKEHFIDIPYEGEIVRVRCMKGGLYLHEGGDKFVKLSDMCGYSKKQISAARDSRFEWMNSVIKSTHYVIGLSEKKYLNVSGISLIEREHVNKSDCAFIGIGQVKSL